MSAEFFAKTGRPEDVAKELLVGWINSRVHPVHNKTVMEIEELARGWALHEGKISSVDEGLRTIVFSARLINTAKVAYSSTDIYNATVVKSEVRVPRYSVIPRVADKAALAARHLGVGDKRARW